MSSFRDRLYLWLPAFLLLMLIVNICGFFWSASRRSADRDIFARTVISFTNQLQLVRASFSNEVLTTFRQTSESISRNLRSFSSSDTSNYDPLDSSDFLHSSFTNFHSSVISERYLYSSIGGVPFIRWYGCRYYEGSFCSLGRIVKIFPDRFYLEDGSYVVNTFNPDVSEYFSRTVSTSVSSSLGGHSDE